MTIGDKTYEIGLKFHREVKPYWVQLEDVRQVNYSGTSTLRATIHRSFGSSTPRRAKTAKNVSG